MQYIDDTRELDSVDGAIGVAVKIINDLQEAGATEALQRLRERCLRASLSLPQCLSDGFTIYYGSLATYRAGFTDAQSFVDGVARTLSAVESNEARHYVSMSDASTSTWIGYDSPVPFGVSYYTVEDFLLIIDGQTLDRQTGAAVLRSLNDKVGQNLRLRIRRGGDGRELEMKLGSRDEVTYRIVEGRSPTPEQLKIRESWQSCK